jgi:predicted TIM-barrel enzyme
VTDRATARARFDERFPGVKPVLAMLHLKGEDEQDRLSRAHTEIDVLLDSGVDALVVENYFGTVTDVENVLAHLQGNYPDAVYGVNVLDDDAAGFALAERYGATFVQLDSVAGHLAPEDDGPFEERLRQWRASTSALVLGGVRFKYQPVLSGNSLATDLQIARSRCDAVVVTGEGTGQETDPGKISEFRRLLGPDFPIVVGAGVTVDNAAEQLALADAAIVGSYLKDSYTDQGDVAGEHVMALMAAVDSVRRGAPEPSGDRR